MSIAGAAARLDWGDVPTWLGVLLAGAAAAVALLLYLRDAERDRQAEADRRARLDEDPPTQATRVGCWYGRAEGQIGPHQSPVPVWGAVVRNASDLPVYDVIVEFHFASPRIDGSLWTLARGQTRRRLIPPGESFVPMPDAMLREIVDTDSYLVAMSFRDAGNRQWRRDPDGVLTEVPPSTQPAALPIRPGASIPE
jgi:hypothetical protein